MKEIKFRAWDGKKMYPEVAAVWADVSNHEKLKTINTSIEEAQKCGLTLMQYTGLKDKNGKEIYIGDILSTFSDDPDTDMWSKEDWGYAVCIDDEEQLGFQFENWHPTTEKDSVFNWEYVEVIGNIYENPELCSV